jgi:hypothetical protein
MSTTSSNASSIQGSWHRLATLFGCKPELAVFRKFRKLNAVKLLDMQSELVQLEEDYRIICSGDAESKCAVTRTYRNDWDALNKSEGRGGACQRNILRKLRGRLDAYSKRIPIPMHQNVG